ncbi:MAG TPA: hypothetical protein VMB50_00605 [Myxococcales bacterium]|nr:hypothetical protein [Myxococcales bacterium]
MPDGDKPRQEARAKLILAGMKTIGYQGMVVGDRDLALGLPFLTDAAKEAGIALYSANLADAAGKPLFPGHLAFQAGPFHVCAVALSPPGNYGPGVQAQDPVAAAQRELATFGAQPCDLKLLLADLPRQQLGDVLKSAPGFDLAAASHDGWQSDPQTLSGVPAISVGQRGRAVARLDVTRNDGHGPFADLGVLSRQADEIGRIDRQIDGLQKQIPTAKDPMKKSLQNRLDAVTHRKADLEKVLATAADPPRSFRTSFVTLDTSVADDPALKKAADAFTAKYPEPPPPRPIARSPFVRGKAPFPMPLRPPPLRTPPLPKTAQAH